MATVAVQITSTGAVGPSYADILQEFRIIYWSIYGSDAVLDPDSQDGQFLATLAQAVFDCDQSVINVYNSFSPTTARSVGLSNLVKLNGLRRAVPTNSQVPVVVVGTIGTQILDGIVGDSVNLNTRWALPALVVIPDLGSIEVTATCTTDGAVVAAPGTITNILTPTSGWQTVNNVDAAEPGQPVESDASLRVRQGQSVALPSLTILDGIYAVVNAVAGVSRLRIYENDDDIPDADGIPDHSIAVVVSGGDVQQVAGAIALKKSPGARTYGTTSIVVFDSKGVPNTIRFFELSSAQLVMQISIHPLPGSGYVSTTGNLLKQSVVDFVNAFLIGEDSYLSRLYGPASLGGVDLGATYVVTEILQARVGNPLAAGDVAVLFNEGTAMSINDVNLVLV